MILIVSFFLSGLIGIFTLGVFLGDTDDNFWWHFLAFAIPAIVFRGYFSNITITTLTRKVLLTIFWIVFVLLILSSIFGIFTNHSLLTLQKYDGMAGIIPYITGIFSIIPLLFIWLIKKIKINPENTAGK